MKVGNLVKATEESGFVLRSGAEWFDTAIVISLDPFVLVSEDTNMKWEVTVKAEDFVTVGTASAEILNECMRRIKQ